MTTQENIKDQMKDAMRAKDTVKLTVLRGLLAAFTNELVATKRTPRDTLTEEEVLVVVTKASKQRKDAIEQFEKGGRQDLADNEKDELVILQTFLPELMSEEEVTAIVQKIVDDLNIKDKSGIGQLMGKVMGELKGKADGGLVKKVVDNILS
jgi:uncharacterized protein YqeY